MASIVFFDIGVVHFAFVDALLSIELEGLPLRTVFSQQRTSQQLFVPCVTSIAFALFAFPCGRVENRHLRGTFATIIGCNILNSRLTFVYTFSSSEVIEL